MKNNPRFTTKQLDETYYLDDVKGIEKSSYCDENKDWFSFYKGEAIDKLGKYEDAEEQGLLLWLPCAVESVVYAINFTFECKYDYDCNEEERWCENGISCKHEYKDYYVRETKFQLSMLAAINKTVFLTREKAEEVLNAMKERMM